jgi:hypothetical protein
MDADSDQAAYRARRDWEVPGTKAASDDFRQSIV